MQSKNRGVLSAVLFVFVLGLGACVIIQKNQKATSQNSCDMQTNQSAASQENQKDAQEALSATQPAWDKLWSIYTSEQGISFKYPKQILGFDACSSKDSYVATKVFEDKEKNTIYIAPEYYYDYQDSTLTNEDGSLNTNQPCKKITYSLDWINKNHANNLDYGPTHNIFAGQNIFIKDVANQDELKKFVKDAFGSDCEMENPDSMDYWDWNDIKVKGTGMEEGNCPMNFAYRISYSQEKKRATAMYLGQDCGMSNISDVSSAGYECYPSEIADSIKFN